MHNSIKVICRLLSAIFSISVLTACTTDSAPVHPTHYEVVTSYVAPVEQNQDDNNSHKSKYIPFDYYGLPEYTNEAAHVVNFNMPYFLDSEISQTSFETYAELDELGRCGPAVACISKETMPAPFEKRGAIGNVRPSGWHTIKYPELIADNYLYNRCHLIGWQLSAENANPQNLVTGTRYLNVTGMLPYEDMVADYIEETNHHVMYRVTPIFIDNELICRGVLMEAQSVEDNDCVFCVFCYNVQPAIKIDYSTGESSIDENYSGIIPDKTGTDITILYVINTKTKKIHRSYCSAVESISDHNKSTYNGDISALLESGYTTCKLCNPEQVTTEEGE